MSFAEATAVVRTGEHSFAADVHPGWAIGGNANGGYLMALMARAAVEVTGKPDPLTMTAHYLAPTKPGPVTIEVDPVRIGGRHATATTTLRSADGKPHMVTITTTTDLARAEGPELVDATPPDLPPVDDCVGMEPPAGADPSSFMQRVELRLHPDDAVFLEGRASGKARVRGWFRLRGEDTDTIGLLVAVDGFPPTVFNAALPLGWVPTVELTAHVRAVPDPGWLRCAFTSRFITGGYLEEDGEVWDRTGRLIAQSRQLALVPRG